MEMEIFLVKMLCKRANKDLFSKESFRNTFRQRNIFAAVLLDVKSVIVCSHTDEHRKGLGTLLIKT